MSSHLHGQLEHFVEGLGAREQSTQSPKGPPAETCPGDALIRRGGLGFDQRDARADVAEQVREEFVPRSDRDEGLLRVKERKGLVADRLEQKIRPADQTLHLVLLLQDNTEALPKHVRELVRTTCKDTKIETENSVGSVLGRTDLSGRDGRCCEAPEKSRPRPPACEPVVRKEPTHRPLP